MTKEIIKTEDSRLVTVGTLKKTLDAALKNERVITSQELRTALKEERVITNQERRLALKEERFITDDGFSRLEQKMIIFQESLEMFAKAILAEIAAMREENREFRMQTAQLDRTYLIHEQKIDDLDTRVLKLETAK